MVEVLLAMSLFVVIASAILGGFISARDGKANQKQSLAAKGYLDQATEALRSVWERDWALISVNGTYHPGLNGSTWELLPNQGPEIDGFKTQIIISDVLRSSADPFGNVVPAGDIIDPASKKATITVSWGLLDRQKLIITQFLTRHENNSNFEQTTEDDFNRGDISGGTVVQNEDGGEIILGAGGQGNWCEPDQSVVQTVPLINLEGQGVANTISAVQGIIYGGTGQNSSGKSFSKVLITQDDPPHTSIAGTLDGYKTNALFGETNYLYIATDTNSEEVAIIDTSGGTYTKVGWVDAPGSADASGIYAMGDIGYVVNGINFSTFDLSSKAGERSVKKTVTLPGMGNSLVVVGSYAYVTTSSSSKELQIVDVSDPSNPVLKGYANTSGGIGKDVFVNSLGTRAFLVTAKTSDDELFVIDTSTKTGSLPVKAFAGSGDMDPKAVTVVPGNKAIMAGAGGEEYQVFTIREDEDGDITLSKCGALDFEFNINDVASVLEDDGDAFSYIATSDSTNEIKVIKGGPGGNYSTEGIFESEIIQRAGDTQFNRVDLDFNEPDVTAVKLQAAVYQPENGLCSNVATPPYVGPDGTNAAFFEESGPVPFASDVAGFVNPAKCFRYKLFLSTTDPNTSPIFNSIKVNYSP